MTDNQKLNVNIDNNVETDEILQKYDKTYNFRVFSNYWGVIISILAISMSLFHLYTATFGVFPTQIQRATHLAFALTLVFLLYPGSSKWPKNKIHIVDLSLATLALIGTLYHIVFYLPLIYRAGAPIPADIVVGVITIILVLEATRRVVGLGLLAVASLFLLYAQFGSFIPGFFGHPGFSFQRIIAHLYLTTEGLIGIPLGVSASFLFLFILFGAFLVSTGLGQVFIDLALSIAGHASGGPAKVAVIASAGFGSLSGSSIANTVTTGAFTIPLMKKIGYKPHFAGAVEAAASTGGQLMPPVMGAAAFLMMEFTNISYLEICIAAAIPAILYFMGVGTMVHFEAKRLGLDGIPKAELPQFKKIIFKSGHLLIPLIAIVTLLIMGYTPVRAAIWAIGLTVLIAAVKKATRLSLKAFLQTLEDGARAALSVAVACSCAGLIIGVVTLTGLGLKMANGIIMLSGGNLYLTMVFTMLASIVLGMGLPTTPKYIILATMAVPALIILDVPLIAAHLFVLYFGVLADVTPPVGLAAYAGAGIAGSSNTKTGLTAFRLTLGAFIVPFIFVLNPQMLLIVGDPSLFEIITVIISAMIGVTCLSVFAIGYLNYKLLIWERPLFLAAALALLYPGLLTDAFGLGVLLYGYMRGRHLVKKTFNSGSGVQSN